MPAWGTTVRVLRVQRGLTQEALGARAGLSQSVISDLERGATPRNTRAVLEQIATALDVDPGVLEGGVVRVERALASMFPPRTE